MHWLGRLTIALLFLAGCRSSEPGAGPGPVPSAEVAPAPVRHKFGAPIGALPSQALGNVLAHPERFVKREVVVEGEVRRACSRRGCWMELAEGSAPELLGCRVTFKDYAFFVPTDSAGSRARVKASVALARLEPAIVSHMESEGARFARKEADGSAQEVRLVASGVELWR